MRSSSDNANLRDAASSAAIRHRRRAVPERYKARRRSAASGLASSQLRRRTQMRPVRPHTSAEVAALRAPHPRAECGHWFLVRPVVHVHGSVVAAGTSRRDRAAPNCACPAASLAQSAAYPRTAPAPSCQALRCPCGNSSVPASVLRGCYSMFNHRATIAQW
jgi:hypothetical protein